MNMMKVSNRGFLILIMHFLRKVEGRTRLQKIVYLVQNLLNHDLGYDFKPYFYGPYSAALQSDIDILKSLGIIREEKTPKGDYMTFVYEATENCDRLAQELRNTFEKTKELENLLQKLEKYDTQSLVALAKRIMAAKQTSQAEP